MFSMFSFVLFTCNTTTVINLCTYSMLFSSKKISNSFVDIRPLVGLNPASFTLCKVRTVLSVSLFCGHVKNNMGVLGSILDAGVGTRMINTMFVYRTLCSVDITAVVTVLVH